MIPAVWWRGDLRLDQPRAERVPLQKLPRVRALSTCSPKLDITERLCYVSPYPNEGGGWPMCCVWAH